MSSIGENTKSFLATSETSNEIPTHIPIDIEVSEKESTQETNDEGAEVSKSNKGIKKADVWDHFNKLKCDNPKDQRATYEDLNLQVMAKKMKIKHDRYWENINNVNNMLFVVVVVDPRCKLAYVNMIIDKFYDKRNAKLLKDKVKSVLMSMFESYSLSLSQSQPLVSDHVENVGSQVVDNVIKMSASSFMDTMFFKKQKVSQGVGGLRNEMEKYLGEDPEDAMEKSFDLLDWWKRNSCKYKTLSMIARDALAMPVSTVASESAFSTGGRVLDSFRSSLSPRVVEALVCVQDWMKSDRHVYLEQSLEQIESMELESSCLTENHPLLNIDD